MPEELIPWSTEYMSEQHRLIGLLQASLDDPDNLEKRKAVNESMARLGFSGSTFLHRQTGNSDE